MSSRYSVVVVVLVVACAPGLWRGRSDAGALKFWELDAAAYYLGVPDAAKNVHHGKGADTFHGTDPVVIAPRDAEDCAPAGNADLVALCQVTKEADCKAIQDAEVRAYCTYSCRDMKKGGFRDLCAKRGRAISCSDVAAGPYRDICMTKRGEVTGGASGPSCQMNEHEEGGRCVHD